MENDSKMGIINFSHARQHRLGSMFSRQPFHLLLRRLFILCGLFVLCGCGDTPALANPVQAQSNEPAPPMQAPKLAHPTYQGMVPDRLVIASIKLDMSVVELGWSSNQTAEGQIFSEWNVAEYAAGWHKNSARLGEVGNVVMSGHNNILGAVFRDLDKLEAGDELAVWSGEEKFAYRVDKVMIVPEKYASHEQQLNNAKWIGAFDDSRLTLVSCWPRDDNTHRIIVIAYPVAARG